MTAVLTYAYQLFLLAVVGALLAGLWTMWNGSNPNRSQTLMRWRVGLQFVAICMAMLAIYFKRGF